MRKRGFGNDGYKREMSDAVGNEGGGPKREKMWSSINGRMRSEHVSILLTPHPSWFSAPQTRQRGGEPEADQRRRRRKRREMGERDDSHLSASEGIRSIRRLFCLLTLFSSLPDIKTHLFASFYDGTPIARVNPRWNIRFFDKFSKHSHFFW